MLDELVQVDYVAKVSHHIVRGGHYFLYLVYASYFLCFGVCMSDN